VLGLSICVFRSVVPKKPIVSYETPKVVDSPKPGKQMPELSDAAVRRCSLRCHCMRSLLILLTISLLVRYLLRFKFVRLRARAGQQPRGSMVRAPEDRFAVIFCDTLRPYLLLLVSQQDASMRTYIMSAHPLQISDCHSVRPLCCSKMDRVQRY
jgi:hypothetical protein